MCKRRFVCPQLNRVTKRFNSNITATMVTYNDLAFDWPRVGINKKGAQPRASLQVK